MAQPASTEPHARVAQRDPALEGLRGLAALMVFYHHLFSAEVGRWSPSAAWTWPVSGPAAVLVFFVLSGYVIGARYRGPTDSGAVREYFRRRFLRIVPINLAGVLLACAVAEALDWPTVLANVFFLESYSDYAGVWVPVLRENSNLWSLNYEVLFYLVFALLWSCRIPLAWAGAGSIALAVLGWFGLGVPVFAACYACGFLFWLAGLALARGSQPAGTASTNWPTCLLLMLVTWKLQGGAELALRFDLTPPRFAGPVVKLYYLEFLPACLWLLATVARRRFRGETLVQALAVLVPLVGFGLRAHGALEAPAFPGENLLLAGLYVSALALWRWRPSVAVFTRVAWLGAISYGLYATARPIQIGVFRHVATWKDGPTAFVIGACMTVVLAFAVAWYLECRLQPALRARRERRCVAAGP